MKKLDPLSMVQISCLISLIRKDTTPSEHFSDAVSLMNSAEEFINSSEYPFQSVETMQTIGMRPYSFEEAVAPTGFGRGKGGEKPKSRLGGITTVTGLERAIKRYIKADSALSKEQPKNVLQTKPSRYFFSKTDWGKALLARQITQFQIYQLTERIQEGINSRGHKGGRPKSFKLKKHSN